MSIFPPWVDGQMKSNLCSLCNFPSLQTFDLPSSLSMIKFSCTGGETVLEHGLHSANMLQLYPYMSQCEIRQKNLSWGLGSAWRQCSNLDVNSPKVTGFQQWFSSWAEKPLSGNTGLCEVWGVSFTLKDQATELGSCTQFKRLLPCLFSS